MSAAHPAQHTAGAVTCPYFSFRFPAYLPGHAHTHARTWQQGPGQTLEEIGAMPPDVADCFFSHNETLAQALVTAANVSLALGSVLLQGGVRVCVCARALVCCAFIVGLGLCTRQKEA